MVIAVLLALSDRPQRWENVVEVGPRRREFAKVGRIGDAGVRPARRVDGITWTVMVTTDAERLRSDVDRGRRLRIADESGPHIGVALSVSAVDAVEGEGEAVAPLGLRDEFDLHEVGEVVPARSARDVGPLVELRGGERA
ncbi:hypothetical protein, partial [Halorubrum halodurans]